jgi:hypothetical protein
MIQQLRDFGSLALQRLVLYQFHSFLWLLEGPDDETEEDFTFLSKTLWEKYQIKKIPEINKVDLG